MSWEERRLGDVVSVKKRINSGSALPYVGMEHISSGTGEFLGELDPVAVKSSTFFFEPGQLLYGRLRPYLNKVLLPKFKGHCSTEVFPIQPSSAIDKKFLFYWFTSDATVSRIDATCTGARMPRADVHEVLDFEIPLPPLPEQQRIVGKLDAAFAALTEAQVHVERNRANARELFESYLNGVFEGKGDGWVDCKLGDICSAITKGTTPTTHGYSYQTEGINFIKVESVSEDHELLPHMFAHVSHECHTFLKRSQLQANDLLFSIAGALGRVAIVHEEHLPANTNQALAIVRLNHDAPVLYEYLMWLLSSDLVVKQTAGMAGGAAQQNLSLTQMKDLDIAYPSKAVQRKIVESLTQMKAESAKLETTYQQKLSELAGLKKAVLGAAFRGEL
jgi:type I restriction enzyme S subunit